MAWHGPDSMAETAGFLVRSVHFEASARGGQLRRVKLEAVGDHCGVDGEPPITDDRLPSKRALATTTYRRTGAGRNRAFVERGTRSDARNRFGRTIAHAALCHILRERRPRGPCHRLLLR